MKYIEFLEKVVVSFGCTIDGSTVISPDGTTPVTLNIGTADKEKIVELVLPTKDRLSKNEWDEVIAFHPACENVTAGQSDIVKFLIRYIRSSIVERSLLLAGELFKLEASKDKKKSTYAKYLSKFPGVDKNTASDFNKVLTTNAKNGEIKTLAKLFVDRKDYIDGELFMRVLAFDSTVFSDTIDDAIFLGTKVRSKAQKVAIRSVLTDIMFGGDVMRGSNAETPYVDVLLNFWVEFCKKYNSIVKMIQKDVKLDLIDIEFAEHIGNMVSYRKRVAALPGCTGEILWKGEVAQSSEAATYAENHIKQLTQPAVQKPQHAEGEEVTSLNFFKQNNGGGFGRQQQQQEKGTGDPLKFRHTHTSGIGGFGGRHGGLTGYSNGGFGQRSGGFGNNNNGSRFGNDNNGSRFGRDNNDNRSKFGK